jgi:GPI mannosyltransferase 3
MPGDTQQRRNWMLAIAAIAVLAIALRIRAFAPFDIMHADELMQYLEQGNRLASGQGIVPWENRYGIRNGLIPQLLSLPLWLGHTLAPDTLTAMLAARWSFIASCLIVLPAAWLLGRLTSRWHALAALFVAATWGESVVFSTLLLSESLATALIVLGAALLLREPPERRVMWAAGLLLGLGVLVRLQYAVFVAVLVLAVLQLDWRRWGQLIAGALAAGLIGALSDIAMGQVPFAWIVNNFAMNIDAGRAARFGSSGPFEYIRLLLVHLGPAAVLILGGAVLAGKRYRPLVWALTANLLIHSLILHKEYRFIWLSVLVIVLLAAIASVTLAQRLLERRGKLLSPAWLALICAGWLGLSMAANFQTGGARSLRGGAPIPLMAVQATKHSGVCGIALPNQWRAHLVPALLPRAVPLFVASGTVITQDGALAPELAAAANALVFASRPRDAEAYREISCRSNGTVKACLFIRPGGCTTAPGWSYQAALEREDL